jgi:hypothetical protein
VHGRLSQGAPIDIACRLYDIQSAANGAVSEQRTHGHEAEGQAPVSQPHSSHGAMDDRAVTNSLHFICILMM